MRLMVVERQSDTRTLTALVLVACLSGIGGRHRHPDRGGQR